MIFRDVLRIDTRPIFEAHTLEDQARLFKKHFKPKVFGAFVRIAASEFIFNRFLHKGHFSGRKETPTDSRPDSRPDSRTPAAFIEQEFTRLFTKTLIRKNYFLQILFLGGIAYEEGLPLEVREDILQAVKKSRTKVSYKRADLVSVIQETPYNFLSLSDTISYLNEPDAHALLQSLPGSTNSGTRAVLRSFLRRPQMPDLTGWLKLEEEEKWARDLDITGVYEFDIAEKY